MVTWDDYFKPVTVRTVNIATDKGLTGKLLYDDEFIYCWNSNTGLPVFNVATTIAERLAKIERTIDYIHRQMRRPTLFSGAQALKSTVDNIMNENDPKTWYVVDKDLSGNARRVGRYLRQELAKLPHVKEVRGKGLLVGCEYDLPIAVEVKHEALERKVLFTAIGDQVNRMIPPLIASKKDVDQLIRVMRESIDEAAAKYLDMKMAG